MPSGNNKYLESLLELGTPELQYGRGSECGARALLRLGRKYHDRHE